MAKAKSPVRGREGFVVLGVLIGIVATIAGAVLIGYLLDRARRPPPAPPAAREQRYATRPLEIRFGALTTARADEGDLLWVRPLPSGEVVVFETARSNRIVGYANAGDLATTPPDPPRALRRRTR